MTVALTGNAWLRRWVRRGEPNALEGPAFFRRWVRRAVQDALEGEFGFRRAVRDGKLAEARLTPFFRGAGATGANSNPATDLTPGIPAGTVADDFMLLVVVINAPNNLPTCDTPTGWTVLIPGSTASACGLFAFYRRATASESAPSVNWGAGAADDVGLSKIFGFGDVDWTDPIDALSALVASDLTTLTFPNITTERPNSRAVVVQGYTATINGNQSAANWTAHAPGPGFETASGDDAGGSVFSREVLNVGTVGGSPTIAFDASTRAVSQTFGFALRGRVV